MRSHAAVVFITAFSVDGVKGLSDVSARDLPAIVGIWGRNGTGKSAIIESLYLALVRNSHLDHSSRLPDAVGLQLPEESSLITEGARQFKIDLIVNPGGHLAYHYPFGKPVDEDEFIYAPTSFYPLNRFVLPFSSTIQGEGDRSPGAPHHLHLDLFVHWATHDAAVRRDFDPSPWSDIQAMNRWAVRFGYGTLVDAPGRKNVVQARFIDPDSKIELPFNLAGGGARAVVTFLLEAWTTRQRLFFIEEPELGLHTRAQRDFILMLRQLARRNKHQFIFTSHSWPIAQMMAQTIMEDAEEGHKPLEALFLTGTEAPGGLDRLDPSRHENAHSGYPGTFLHEISPDGPDDFEPWMRE